MMDKIHSLPPDQVLKVLNTSPDIGLSEQEAKKRLHLYGPNVLEEEKINKLDIFFRQFKSILVVILILAAFISIFISRWQDFFIIIGIVFINGFIGFWQELKAAFSLKALKKLTESKETIIRGGKRREVLSSELVPGDLVIFAEGDTITADIRILESSSLMVDESSLTGESVPVLKDPFFIPPEEAFPYELKNMLFAGTTAVRGNARGIVVRTGGSTYFATIAKKGEVSAPKSPLIRALDYFARRYTLLLIGLFLAVGIYGALQQRSIRDVAYIFLAELVSAVPEGLPIVVTLVMVVGAVALSKKNTLIRYLPSVETLGSTTIIASDKTGTITQGKLEVEEVVALDEGNLKKVAVLCNDAKDESGDPIDVALLKWVEGSDKIQKKHPRVWEHPFDITLRAMATVNETDGKLCLFIKGAYETLKGMAENKEDFDRLERELLNMAKKGLRTLCFGMGMWDKENPYVWKIKIVGLIGFLDPPKEGVRTAVLKAKRAGINLLMVTGDFSQTAKTIAKDVAIWEKDKLVLTGKEIDEMEDEELFLSLRKAAIAARILPEHKFRIVSILQRKGHIVAVSGDGVNDVPALRAADLGIAMGSGTEAAKSAAKMVITDSNLKVIVEAIRYGRVIADNIRKVIYYLLSSAICEISLISFAIFYNFPLPLFPIHILWINLVTDGVQDKAFAFAKAEEKIMERKPRAPSKQFFDMAQLLNIFYFGFVVGVASFILFKHLLRTYPYEIAVTITFTCVVVVQWFNGIQAQKEKEPFFKDIKRSFLINPYIYLGISAGVLLQLVAVYVVPSWFYTVPISFNMWKYPFFFALFAFFVIEIKKWFVYGINSLLRKSS